MLKQVLAVLLSLVMCMSMLTPAFAADEETEPQPEVVETVTGNLSNDEDNDIPAEDKGSDTALIVPNETHTQETDLSADEEESSDLQTEPDETDESKKDDSLPHEESSEDSMTNTDITSDDESLPESEVEEARAEDGTEGNGEFGPEILEENTILGPDLTTAMQPTAVFAAAKTTNLNIEHITEEPKGSEEPSSGIELKKDETGVITAFVKIEDKNINISDDFSGTGWYKYGTVSLNGVELPENPEIKQCVNLDAPIYTEINGNKVCWTNLKYEGDGWHLDGAITYPTTIDIISVQDKTGNFSSETEISEIRNGWHNLNAEELHEILGAIDLPAASPDQPPAVSAEISKKINDYLASKGWSGGTDSISWKYTYAGKEGWHLDGYLNVEKQEVNTVISDPSGQLYEASDGQIDYAKWNDEYSYWHTVVKNEFLLPDPALYNKDETIELTPVQLKQIQDKFSAVTGWDGSGDKDGTIKWEFRSLRDSVGKARWDLQGTYVPDTISIYVYMAGAPDMEGTVGTNGNVISETIKETLGTNQEWADEWYTAGKIKLPLTEELQTLLNANDLSGMLEYVKTNASGLLSVYEPNQAFWEGKDFSSLEWYELSEAAGAKDYLDRGIYKTLHLNGIFRNPSTTNPEDTKDPPKGEDPENPSGGGSSGENPSPINPPGGENPPPVTPPDGEDPPPITPPGGEDPEPVPPPKEEPVVPPEEIDPVIPPIIIEDGGDDSEDSEPTEPLLFPEESLITIEDQQTPMTMLPKELWVTPNYTPYIYGRTDSTLNPDETLLRNEFAVILFRLLSEEAHTTFDTSENEYPDVAITAWYNDAVSTLTAMGILEGFYDGGYHPAETITRDAFIKALAAMFEIPEDFTFDVASSDHITRAEAVVVINRLLGWEQNGDLPAGHTHYTDVNEETPNYWDLMIASSKKPEED